MRHAIRFAAAAAVLAAIALIGHSARAFTIENQSPFDANGNARFADPDDEVQNFGRGGMLFGQSGPSVQFGAGIFDGGPGGANWVRPFGPRSFGAGN